MVLPTPPLPVIANFMLEFLRGIVLTVELSSIASQIAVYLMLRIKSRIFVSYVLKMIRAML